MLAASDADITMFHVMTPQRLDGIAAVRDLYAPYAGQPLFDSYQIEKPRCRPPATWPF